MLLLMADMILKWFGANSLPAVHPLSIYHLAKHCAVPRGQNYQ